MRLVGRNGLTRVLVVGLVALGVALAVADLADVHLKSGVVLRGDVTTTEAEVILRNEAGEVRFARDIVSHITPVTGALPKTRTVAEEYGRRLRELAREDLEGHLALALWLSEQGRYALALERCAHVLELDPENRSAAALQSKCRVLLKHGDGADNAEEDGVATDSTELEAAPLLSERDIQRLKLSELRLAGKAEPVRVDFVRLPGQEDLPRVVLDRLLERKDFDARWQDVLVRGRPFEKLQVIVQTTGMEYLDRIEVGGDPEAFNLFRRRVLPLVQRSCGRSRCHAGSEASAFRLPEGAIRSEAYAYTTFVLLDGMETRHGPLIDRMEPEKSVLLGYLLPLSDNPLAHVELEGGRRYPAVLRRPKGRSYDTIVGWIGSLRLPRPAYGLDYAYPYPRLARDTVRDEARAPGSPEAETQPATREP